jgi:RNA polymerase sigma-70 factor (ECF subfamily)
MRDSINSTAGDKPTELKDEELVAGYRKGAINRDVLLSALVSRYIKYLLFLGQGQGLSIEEAEDIVQETFLKVLEKIATFDITKDFRVWLRLLFYRQLSKRKKQRGLETKVDSESDYLPEGLDSFPSTSPIDAERHAIIEEALKHLTPNERELIFLITQGMSFPEIAKINNISENSVRVRLFRARQKLKQHLSNKGVLEE